MATLQDILNSIDASNTKAESTYSGISQYTQDLLQNQGESSKQAAKLANQNAQAQGTQSLISRGLANTTTMDAQNRNYSKDLTQQNMAIDEQVAAQKAGMFANTQTNLANYQAQQARLNAQLAQQGAAAQAGTYHGQNVSGNFTGGGGGGSGGSGGGGKGLGGSQGDPDSQPFGQGGQGSGSGGGRSLGGASSNYMPTQALTAQGGSINGPQGGMPQPGAGATFNPQTQQFDPMSQPNPAYQMPGAQGGNSFNLQNYMQQGSGTNPNALLDGMPYEFAPGQQQDFSENSWLDGMPPQGGQGGYQQLGSSPSIPTGSGDASMEKQGVGGFGSGFFGYYEG